MAQRTMRRVGDLRPNPYNQQVFSDSLTPEGVRLLAESLELVGQSSPILALPDGTIIDGERRWRAAQQLGWEEVWCQTEDLSPAQVEERVRSYGGATRHQSLREQVKLYQEHLKALKKAHGRSGGRPGKTFPEKGKVSGDQLEADPAEINLPRKGEGLGEEVQGAGASTGPTPAKPAGQVPAGAPGETFPFSGKVFRTPEDLCREAARLARFPSHRIAERAEAIFTRGSPDLQELVLAGEMSITGAYAMVGKKPRRLPKPKQDKPRALRQMAEGGQGAGPNQDATQQVPLGREGDRMVFRMGRWVLEQGVLEEDPFEVPEPGGDDRSPREQAEEAMEVLSRWIVSEGIRVDARHAWELVIQWSHGVKQSLKGLG